MKKIILFIILIVPAISLAQESNCKRLSLKNDILHPCNSSINVDPIRINQNTENISAFCTSSLGANNLCVTPNDTIIKHKLILYRTLVSSSNYMNGRWSSSSYMKITGFNVEDLNSYKFSHLMRELKPYVKDDKTAFRLYRRSRAYAGISKGATYFCLASVLGGMFKILSGVNEMKELNLYTRSFMVGIGFMLASGVEHTYSLKKCIKVYNKNAGFGYVNGLEKVKKNKKDK
jgi:hypothetical protein